MKASRACDSCRRRKIRCNGAGPCSNCISSNADCQFNFVEKPRKKPERSAKRIDELKARVEWIENYLETARLAPPGYGAVVRDPVAKGLVTLEYDFDPTLLTEGLSARTCGDVDVSLPPIAEARSLLQMYFDSFNQVIPLFDQMSFNLLVDTRYGSNDHQPVGWWPAGNVALSLAHRLRAVGNLSAEEENEREWAYLRNASRAVSGLTLRKPNLLGIQAILGMAILLQGTPDPRPASTLVTIAVRLCHSLGLHKNEVDPRLDRALIEQRKRTFWIAYQLDKDYSLRLDQPPVQNDDDIDVDLPSSIPEDGLGEIRALDGISVMNFFRKWVDLAIIIGKVYSMLYCAQALRQTAEERSQAVNALNLRLKHWTRSIPEAFRPENMTMTLSKMSTVHMVVLYLSYFNCVAKVNFVPFNQNTWAAEKITPRECLEADYGRRLPESCLQAARVAMRLVGLAPVGDHACLWAVIYPYVSALIIVLVNVTHNPTNPLARSDLQLAQSCIDFLDSLSRGEKSTKELKNMYAFCVELKNSAEDAVGLVSFLESQAGFGGVKSAKIAGYQRA